ncbi:DUF397 domain-containing protein [Streptomyces sp. PA03-6a]|nr:DUF397 domain-containing protein [Streptomyces sp. PA03-6a]
MPSSGRTGVSATGWSWRKSSASDSIGSQCVEVAWTGAAVLVRDSKDRQGPVLTFTPDAWRTFLADADASLAETPHD